MILNLASNPFISGNISYSDKEINHIDIEAYSLSEEKLTSKIDLRYKLGNEILNAVEKGLKEEALKLEKSFHFSVAHRAPNNLLRVNKNLAFSFNTLLRIACEHVGVSPIYISNLSDKFAILIENLPTMVQLEPIITRIISEYCDLVNEFYTAVYSKVTKKLLITLI